MLKRIVIKVGTSTLTGGGARDNSGQIISGPDRVYINTLAAQIAEQRAQGRQVVLVTSGAIQAGLARLGRTERPRTIPEKQAAASVGQGVLMGLYADVFANYGIAVGQVLLTRDDLRRRARYLNARNTFEALLASGGALPIVNENDTVAVDEIKVGDNDTLAALVASLIDADALLLLSDVAGLYDRNPTLHSEARLIERVENLDAATLAMAGEAGTDSGTGGMRTKLAAARIATSSGIALWIGSGRRANVIADCLNGVTGSGTFFVPSPARPSAHKRWLAWGAGTPNGVIVVNACARRALETEGRSLLPIGVIEARGDFDAGDLVGLEDSETGEIFAHGVSRYAAGEVVRVAGRATSEITALSGGAPAPRPEVIHRDRLAFLRSPAVPDRVV